MTTSSEMFLQSTCVRYMSLSAKAIRSHRNWLRHLLCWQQRKKVINADWLFDVSLNLKAQKCFSPPGFQKLLNPLPKASIHLHSWRLFLAAVQIKQALREQRRHRSVYCMSICCCFLCRLTEWSRCIWTLPSWLTASVFMWPSWIIPDPLTASGCDSVWYTDLLPGNTVPKTCC